MGNAEAFKLQQEQLAAAGTTLPVASDADVVDTGELNLPAMHAAESNTMDTQNGDVASVQIPNGVASEDLLAVMTADVGEVAKDEIEKLPVYGSARANYQLDPVPDELADIMKDDLKSQEDVDEEHEEEEEVIAPISRKPKLNYVSQFTKGETLLPASTDAKTSKLEESIDERTENVKEKSDDEEEEEEEEEGDDSSMMEDMIFILNRRWKTRRRRRRRRMSFMLLICLLMRWTTLTHSLRWL